MPSHALALLIITAVLIAVGLVVISSLEVSAKMNLYGGVAREIFRSHVTKLVVGVVLLVITSFVDYRYHEKYAWFYYVLAIFLLVLPYAFPPVAGSRRWILLGNFSFQPSEFAKFALIVCCGAYIKKHQDRMRSFVDGFLKPFLMAIPVLILVFLEPDLSSCIVIMLVVMLMLYSHGTRLIYVLSTLASLGFLFIAAQKFGILLKGYQISRLKAFFTGDLPDQVMQAVRALKEGGLVGKGVGLGEVKLSVPAVVTDFVFAAIGEELGLVGIIAVVLLFFLLVWTMLKLVESSRDVFVTSFVSGLSLLIMVQVLVNLGVVAGMFPVTGVTLPFISYGGSSMAVMMASLGVVVNMATSGSEIG
ncbi:FtsW/RodA/SpoVE family cell cycle protein [Thermotoga caldifontis]|uniref:FtsW/RodA/SpoVE family cell cycle protein n=1 Tax=Thermotoga caldifontis TaxID=1508419 RepID=UPI000693BE47|nr:FtsW/RodA/SpoVE family cell cycle protein [Thermotoga caldifontis]